MTIYHPTLKTVRAVFNYEHTPTGENIQVNISATRVDGTVPCKRSIKRALRKYIQQYLGVKIHSRVLARIMQHNVWVEGGVKIDSLTKKVAQQELDDALLSYRASEEDEGYCHFCDECCGGDCEDARLMHRAGQEQQCYYDSISDAD